MKKLLCLLVVAAIGYGVWDIVRTVRGSYTTTFSRTYSQAVGLMMSPAFDSLDLRGRGVRIGVLDAGFGREEQSSIKPDFVLPASPPGTSFSTPIVAGLCACVLEYRRMERDALIDYLHRSATHALSPDHATGYGVPQTETLLQLLAQ